MFRFSHVVQSLTYGQPEYYIVQGIIFNVLMALILNKNLLLKEQTSINASPHSKTLYSVFQATVGYL